MKHARTARFSRPIIPLNRINDPSGCAKALDLYVESLVTGRAKSRAIVINGPIGSNKRGLALAAAAEFGTTVREIEPNSLVSRDELAALLASVGSEGVLVIHNFDELPARAQMDLSCLITTGHPLERSNPYADPRESMTMQSDIEPPNMIIITTNAMSCLPPPIIQSAPIFTLRRYRETIRESLERKLRASSASCDPGLLNQLVDLIYLAPTDRFEPVSTVLISQASRNEGGIVDASNGADLIGMCWGSMATGEVVLSLKSLIEERRMSSPDIAALAEELGVPAALRADVCRAAEEAELGVPRRSKRGSMSHFDLSDGDESSE